MPFPIGCSNNQASSDDNQASAEAAPCTSPPGIADEPVNDEHNHHASVSVLQAGISENCPSQDVVPGATLPVPRNHADDQVGLDCVGNWTLAPTWETPGDQVAVREHNPAAATSTHPTGEDEGIVQRKRSAVVETKIPDPQTGTIDEPGTAGASLAAEGSVDSQADVDGNLSFPPSTVPLGSDKTSTPSTPMEQVGPALVTPVRAPHALSPHTSAGELCGAGSGTRHQLHSQVRQSCVSRRALVFAGSG